MCLQLHQGTWKTHSTFNLYRYGYSAVATQTAVFVFGGDLRTSYEYLPKDSNTWYMGKNEIPGGFFKGHAIAVKSEQEIWLIGGHGNQRRILSFNVKEHTFHKLPFKLESGRVGHRCDFIPNTNKIMITGGIACNLFNYTEILDIEGGSVTEASRINCYRSDHGMGVITFNGEDRLAIFGGNSEKRTWLDSVEVYNTQTEEWEITTLKLNKPKSDFGFLTIKLGDVIQKCLSQ